MSAPGKKSPSELLRTYAYRDNIPQVRRLILEGADINIWDKYGYTALTHAAAQGHLELVTLLLANGAWVDPHEDYDTYDTPLMLAIGNGHFDVVKKLIEAGAQPLWHVGTAQMTAENYARGCHKEIHDYILDVIAKINPHPLPPATPKKQFPISN